MKKTLVLLFAICALTANAQNEKSFQVITGLGGALTFGEMPSYGISASVEPKVFITNNIVVGLRFEGDVLFGGNIDSQNPQDISVSMSSRTAQLLKAEYYLSDLKVRPYAGFGFGRYTQANIGTLGTGEVSIAAVNTFGVAPEFGLAFGSFRLSAIYNIVPGKDLVTIDVGDVRNVSRNYLVLQMSWKLFRIKF